MPEMTTFYLEMKSPDGIREKEMPDGLEVIEAELKEFRFNRYLYQFDGENETGTIKYLFQMVSGSIMQKVMTCEPG